MPKDEQVLQDRMVHPAHTSNKRETTSYWRSLSGRARLLRRQTRQDHDEPRAQPEGLHDADDNEGVGPDAVDKQAHEGAQMPQGKTAVEGVAGSPVYAEGRPEQHADQDEKRDQPDKARVGQNHGNLAIHERIPRDPVAQEGPLDEILRED